MGVPATRLHFLGGVAGWGYPAVGDDQLPVLKATLHFAGGGTEEMVFRNGRRLPITLDSLTSRNRRGFPIHEARTDPLALGRGSRHQRDRVSHPRKLRTITWPRRCLPSRRTTDRAEPSRPPRRHRRPSRRRQRCVRRPRVPCGFWIVGGGSSHDFQRFFNLADVATLGELPGAVVAYTENTDEIASAAPFADAIYLSNNKPIGNAASRGCVSACAVRQGSPADPSRVVVQLGRLAVHNRDLVGGGARSHDRYGEFEVTVLTDVKSPVSAGLPASFKVSDELYHYVRDDSGVPPLSWPRGSLRMMGESFPAAWLSQVRDGRVVCYPGDTMARRTATRRIASCCSRLRNGPPDVSR